MSFRVKRACKVMAFGLVAIALCRFLIPCPLEGNWAGGDGYFTVCGCDAHRFIRFSEGMATEFDEHSDTGIQIPYRKIARNLYEYKAYDAIWSDDGLSYRLAPNRGTTFQPGWFFMKLSHAGETFWLHRDYRLRRARLIIARTSHHRTLDEMRSLVVEKRKRETEQ